MPAPSKQFALVPLALASGLMLSACSIAGSYRVAEGTNASRGYRSVAGEVRVGRDATIKNAKTVAGSIEIDDRATTGSLSSVAGSIRVGEAVKITGNVSTVAGGIDLGRGTRVTGEVSTVAGEIELKDCRVEGPVKITKGSLKIRGATVLPAGIVVRHAKVGDHPEEPTKIDIGPGAEIASITVEPNTPVDLRISSEARIGKITGATATTY